MRLDTLFTLASMTKLLTSLAALQLVDRGLVSLSEDITPHLPALASKPILRPDGTLTPRTKPITLRHLLTHSSGCGYHSLSPRLAAHVGPSPRPTTTVEARFDYPLLFEPGSSWAYGCGIDWAGRLVEVLTGEALETYLQKNILVPLGIDPAAGRLGFFPERPGTAQAAKLARLAVRDPDSGRVVHASGPSFLGLPRPAAPGEEEQKCAAFGGESGFADLGVYIEVLYSLLVDDGKLLSPAVAAQVFQPALEKEAKAALLEEVKHPEWIVGWVPDTGEYDWGLAGLLVDGDGHERRRRGFLFWGGVFNMAWFLDREAGVCGVFGTQIQVPADPKVRPLIKAFEDEIYAKL